MKRPRSLGYLVAAFALVLAANALLLAAAAWNRHDGERARLILTERELALPTDRPADSTGLFLSVKLSQDPPDRVREVSFRRRYELPRTAYPWLDRDKLHELGFRLEDRPADPGDEHGHASPGTRRAFVVLELEGDAWSKWIAAEADRVAALRAQVAAGTAPAADLADAESLLAIDRTMRSRLVPIDAGRDEALLRRRYPDASRYAVVEGIIVVGSARTESGEVEPRGRVLGLVVGEIYVPRELRSRLDALPAEEPVPETNPAWPAPREARYQATVAFGRRNEPWLVEVR